MGSLHVCIHGIGGRGRVRWEIIGDCMYGMELQLNNRNFIFSCMYKLDMASLFLGVVREH